LFLLQQARAVAPFIEEFSPQNDLYVAFSTKECSLCLRP